MKKTKVIEMLQNHDGAIKKLDTLERGKTYLIRKAGNEFPVQLTHFYEKFIRFKVLSNPVKRKALAKFHNVHYIKMDNLNITPISTKELMEYFGTATPHLAECIRNQRSTSEKRTDRIHS